MVRPRRKPAARPVAGHPRKGRLGRTARAMANPQTDAQRLSADIGTTIRSIRMMIDSDPSVLAGAEPQKSAACTPKPMLSQLWHAWGERMLARLKPAPVAPPVVVVEQPAPPPVNVPTPRDVADLVLGHPDLQVHLQTAVQQELNGALGMKFSANLRAVIRSQVAMAVEDQMADA